jgi:hypothetical protein
MRHPVLLAICAGLLILIAGVVSAQHHDPKLHGHGPADSSDTRVLVDMPTNMAVHMLANMRDHLLAMQEIQDALAKGDNGKAAKIAEERLGMTSLKLHGAHDVAKYMPQGMRDAGSGMHRAASRFAIAAQDAGVTGELKPALAALSAVTAQCVGCHAGYRVK